MNTTITILLLLFTRTIFAGEDQLILREEDDAELFSVDNKTTNSSYTRNRKPYKFGIGSLVGSAFLGVALDYGIQAVSNYMNRRRGRR